MPRANHSVGPQSVIVRLLKQRLSSLRTEGLRAIPFQGGLFIRNAALNARLLHHGDFSILMCAKSSAIRICDLERGHDVTFLCAADYCLTNASHVFDSNVECEVAEHPDLMRLLALERADLIAHLANYWAPIVIQVLDDL